MTKTIPDPPKTLRGQRLTLGLTQVELADLCTQHGAQISDVALSALERDLTSPRPRLRAVLCTLLDLPISYFDEDEREERKKRRQERRQEQAEQVAR